jgi:outer membrane lipoprotein LolB
MIKILLAVLTVMLSSCAVFVKTTSTPPDIKAWQQHLGQVKNINGWDIRGRVSIQTKDDGGPADLFWQQTDSKHFDIKLVAPFGAGTLHLQGQPTGVLLTTSDGEQIMAQTADDLIRQVQGWHFPVSGLRYWLLGTPAPSSKSELVSWNEQGLLYVLHQDGWRIEMRKYKKVANKILPGKLFISRLNEEEVDVRVIIREWNLKND